MSDGQQVERQRAFYAAGAHTHLQPRADDFYADKLAAAVARATGMGRGDRVLELGAGFGRFTFSLLEHCGSLVALDLSPRALETLVEHRDRRGIPESRCRVLCADLDDLREGMLAGGIDFVVGFFILHHLPDVAGAIARLQQTARPRGGMAFVEPNRRNPLFAAQIACCPDMHWREERGMFRLSARAVEGAYRRAGLEDVSTERFGFFPPQVLNRWEAARRLEARLEAIPWLRGGLPFLLLCARPATPGRRA